jgi:glycosyltransferase involved in cell wall biosynthesis
MRILVASNDLTFNPALIDAYRAAGHEVHAGVPNFMLGLGDYDVIHLHWPEELVGFGVNSADPAKTQPVLDRIDQWAKRAVLVATVHNLVPHSTKRLDGPEASYFDKFYSRIDIICHFSEYSRARYLETFPNIPLAAQLVHGLNSFDHLLPLAQGTGAARKALGLPEDQYVFSVIGALRKPEELSLLRHGWSQARLNQANLLLAANPPWYEMRLHHRMVDKMMHRRWLRVNPLVRTMGGNLDDKTLVRVVEASDALIVPRFGLHLNSGLVPLALTFGTAVIAPDYGLCREQLSASANSLYAAGDPTALAQALHQQVMLDPAKVRRENLEFIRSTGGWANILATIWQTVKQRGRDKGIRAFFGS